MENLKRGLLLRQLSESLTANRNEPCNYKRRVMKAFRQLGAGRPRLLTALRASRALGIELSSQNPKLSLWLAYSGHLNAATENADELLRELQKTDAWSKAGESLEKETKNLLQQRWNYLGRIKNVDQVLKGLQKQPEAPIIFWHHYDKRGEIPRSWLEVLKELRKRGWCVVVSSSGISAEAHGNLQQHGIAIQMRENIGLCLGAYRDFCCLLNESDNQLGDRPRLVLANDSTLPVGGAMAFMNMLTSMANQQNTSIAQLSGVTDSVERGNYHIQSYFLMANSKLILMHAWHDFWKNFSITGDKDDLINRGELGLSQALLRKGVKLQAQYSLVKMLYDVANVSEELKQLEIKELHQVNLSLFAWKSLLEEGCPLIKKNVIFNHRTDATLTIPLSEVKHYLAQEDESLVQDLEDLIRSRYLVS